MGRILSIDYGEKRIGLALSDELKITAQPFDVIINDDIKTTIEKIFSIVSEKNVEKIILGLPLNLKGQKHEQAKIIEKFKIMLEEKVAIPVIFQDERLTSAEAVKILSKGGVRTGKNKGKIDKLAASILLQTYLDSN